MSLVRTERLSKVYQMGETALHALRDVEMTIDPGEYVAIMGPSGSGKSTLLNLLGCLDRPSQGRYFLGGEDVSQLDDRRLSAVRGARIGFIFQSYNLIPQLNVIENIEVPMFYRGWSETRSESRARELADLVGRRPPDPPADRTERRPAATRRHRPGLGQRPRRAPRRRTHRKPRFTQRRRNPHHPRRPASAR